MKNVFITILMLGLGFSLNAKNIDGNMLITKDGAAYVKDQQEVFTGNAYFFFEDGKTKKNCTVLSRTN
jgi:hypothetical protein